LKSLIKKTSRLLGIEITRCKSPANHENKCLTFKTERSHKGNALLSYIIEPFFLNRGEEVSNAHTNHWESLQIGKTLSQFGYDVDVIDFHNEVFKPTKNYSCFIGVRTNFERIVQRLNQDCLRIVHLDTAHWLFNNSATYKRTLELQQRKGMTIKWSQRIVEHNLAIEYSDYATMLGNKFTASTYQYAQKPIFSIPISTCGIYPWAQDKNFETCRNHFLWFGSNGFVHKGLDLVLEVFAGMPNYHLYICGPVKDEDNFEKAFYKELYQTPNIHVVGWVDVSSVDFIEITNKCIGLIYPSSSEGQSGSVVNCLHAGLIPLISYESGVDVDDFGVILGDCSIETIKKAVQMLSSLPAEKLKVMSRKAWEFARTNHTRERFAEEYQKAMEKIIADGARKNQI
jgi:glycosyltransferase involved in cell wall biosynthesis